MNSDATLPTAIAQRYPSSGLPRTGAHADVFFSVHPDHGPVAIKIARSPATSAWIDREIGNLRELWTHDGAAQHLLPILEDGSEDRRRYFVLPRLDGTLEERIRAPEWPDPTADLRDRLRILQRLCEIVWWLHDGQFLHTDIKPANVLLSAETGAVWLVDFGGARVSANSAPTHSLLYSDDYAAPEQTLPTTRPLQPSVDLHSLALTTFEGITRKRPRIQRRYTAEGRELAALTALPQRTEEESARYEALRSLPPEALFRFSATRSRSIRPRLLQKAFEAALVDKVIARVLAESLLGPMIQQMSLPDPAARVGSAEDLAAALQVCQKMLPDAPALALAPPPTARRRAALPAAIISAATLAVLMGSLGVPVHANPALAHNFAAAPPPARLPSITLPPPPPPSPPPSPAPPPAPLLELPLLPVTFSHVSSVPHVEVNGQKVDNTDTLGAGVHKLAIRPAGAPPCASTLQLTAARSGWSVSLDGAPHGVAERLRLVCQMSGSTHVSIEE